MQATIKRLNYIISFIATVFLTVVFCLQSSVYAKQPKLTVIAGDKIYTFIDKEFSHYNKKTYLNCLEGVVDKIYYDTLITPTDATLKFTPNSSVPFTIVKEKSGLSINRSKLIDDINYALNNNKAVVKANFITVDAEITKESLAKYTNVLATFSTNYEYSNENRKHNIKLATENINGYVIKSGETFSFNKIVGERSQANGFKDAVIIENGEYVQGVGGGVCQVSSTLYNTALLSGLKVTERFSHSILPNYVEPSFDAMVSGNFCDLKFENVTSGNVYIAGFASGSTVSFTFYGEKPNFSYQRESLIVGELTPLPDEIIEDDSLFEGVTQVVKNSKSGIKSEGYLLVYSQGKVVKRIKLHKDEYKSVRGVIKVGTKKNSISGNIIDKAVQIS